MRTRERAIVVLAASALAGCGSHHHSGGSAPAVHFETEPNDFACCADPVGVVGVDDFVPIVGSITDVGTDEHDGFALVAAHPLTLELRLFADQPADLDLCVWDPLLGDFVGCFETPFDPEVGFVHVLSGGAELHLVVSSFAGTASYTLEVVAHPLALAAAAVEGGAVGGVVVEGAGDGHGKPEERARHARYAGAEAVDAADAAERPGVVGRGVLVLFSEEGEVVVTADLGVSSEGAWVWMGAPEGEATEER